MKRKFLLTLLIFSGISSVALAQGQGKGEFGFNIGINSATVQYSGTSQNADYRDGLNLGVSAEFYFSDRWSIKGKLIYDQKGWANGFLILPDNTEIDGVDYHLNYFTVPIMANWHFGQRRNWYLDFGPYLGFLASASETSNSADVKPLFTSTDIGIAFGLGVKFPISNRASLFFEAEGAGGFNNVFVTSQGGSYQNIRSSLNMGVIFPMK